LADEFTDTEKSLSCCKAYDKATSVPVSYGSCQCCAHTQVYQLKQHACAVGMATDLRFTDHGFKSLVTA